MARFHFHQQNGRDYPDREGVDLPDMHAVRRTALLALTELVLAHEREFWRTGEWRLTVTDAQGATVLRLALSTTEAPTASRSGPSPRQGGLGG